ncbi:DNA primase [Streptomyces sp. CA-294286]|uniref:DNA primase n=1 Tax=Streptomyces sp. CA-294286 TaxID=3240070 RepID=UPI003D8A4754
MNNRLGLGLAVGAGYLLGRTKKLKFAFAVGTFVAGKKLQLSPKALMDLASSQLQNNPQFKELGDQLREDMRGAGKAATGAIINRQLSGLADKLHDRTLSVQDKAAGVVPDITSMKDQKDRDQDEEPEEEEEEQRETPRRQTRKKAASSDSESESGSRSRSGSGSRTAKKTASSAAKKTASGTAKKTASGTARKTAGTTKKTAAKKTAAKGGQGRG